MRKMVHKIKLNSSLKKHNNGFTLVELIVVLVLMAIMMTVTIAGGIAWQDWSKFQHEDSAAEDIFYAVQNQLTGFDSSGAMNYKVTRKLLNGGNESTGSGYESKYVLATVDNPANLGNIVYKENDGDGVAYSWDTIWGEYKYTKNDAELSQEAAILKLYAAADQYNRYLEIRSTDDPETLMDAGTILLFDMISPYIADPSILNGAILVEFSPEAGQVFSVCYSDNQKSFVKDDGSGDYLPVAKDRRITTRNKNMVGYYSAEQLFEKLNGRSERDSDLTLEFESNEVFTMVLTVPQGENCSTNSGDKLVFKLYDGDNGAERDLVMSFSMEFDPDDITCASLTEAANDPTPVTFAMGKGVYKGSEIKTWVPVWKTGDGNEIKLHFCLDAADMQAQSATFAAAEIDKDEDAQTAFKNTFSFYRFGVAENVDYLFGYVESISSTDGQQSGTYSIRRVLATGDNPEGKALHTESLNENGSAGECVTFASCEWDEADNQKRTLSITNGRHLYNVRFETDYKKNAERKNIFRIDADIDWHQFVGIKPILDEHGDPISETQINYFLNSFPGGLRTDEDNNQVVTGINYSGYLKATHGDGNAEHVIRDTSRVPFPGFRRLDINDTFRNADGEEYRISNLEISLTANLAYGVYDSVFDNYDVLRWYQSLDLTGILADCKTGTYTGILGISSETEDSKGSNPSRAGLLPLGLFAENFGTISSVFLDKHIVRGMEVPDGETGIIYTCMVGGFAGDNFGTVENLTLLDSFDEAVDPDDNKTLINGRTDVGGIIGRQSFVASESLKYMTLSGLRNEGTVTGYENVGGIVGRVYTHYVGDTNDLVPDGNLFDEERSAEYHDGYFISDESVSSSGDDIYRAISVNLNGCRNTGRVHGDDLIYGYPDQNYLLDDVNVNGLHCAFIGGIAGCVQDGCICDSSVRPNPLNDYDDFYEVGTSFVSIENCASKVLYTQSEIDRISQNVQMAETRDCYVGGLIGYGRLAVIRDCDVFNDSEDPIDPENPGQGTEVKETFEQGQSGYPLVAGRRYVGGVIGCSDECTYKKSSNVYSAVNDNLVIGERYIGGIAGAFGIGSSDAAELSFRNPASNNASQPTQVYTDLTVREGFVIDLLNQGIVLGRASEKAFETTTDEDGVDDNSPLGGGMVGGIAGVSMVPLQKADNLQTSATKNYLLSLIGYDSNTLELDDILLLTDNSSNDSSPFGGNYVGGLVGQMCSYANRKIADELTESKVDAIVFGQDAVGGAFGLLESGYNAYNIYPSLNNADSDGLVVMGRDAVGGIIGKCNGIYNDETRAQRKDDSIAVPYSVYGRYGVGGICGNITNTEDAFVYAASELSDDEQINVYGRAYTGGSVGVCEKDDISISGSFLDIKVNADYFAGGVCGAVINMTSLSENASPVIQTDVNAKAFAGGFAGLFTAVSDFEFAVSEDDSSDGSLLHMLADDYLTGKEIQGVFNGLINPDINGTGSFSVDTQYDSNLDLTGIAVTGNCEVKSQLFAGGLFGYIPARLKTTISNFTNDGVINVSGNITSTNDRPGISNEKYAYLGGVCGRIPADVTLINCYNRSDADNYIADTASYIGGLTEINAGTVKGLADSPCLNETERTYTGSHSYGAFAGINNGTIEYCRNSAEVKSGNMAAGIAVVCGTGSVISQCSNMGTVYGENESAGIAAVASADSSISDCSNKGTVKSKDGAAAGIAARTAGTSVSISKCINEKFGDEEKNNATLVESQNGVAAGIVGKNTGIVTVSECENKGKVNSVSLYAAGIMGQNDKNQTKAFSILNSINMGAVLYNNASDVENIAGIIYGTSGVGTVNLCRNYGRDLKYVISKEELEKMTYCLNAANTDAEGEQAVFTSAGVQYGNFNVEDEPEHAYEFQAYYGYTDWKYMNNSTGSTAIIPADKIIQPDDMHGLQDDAEGLNNINELVLSPYQDDPSEHKEGSAFSYIGTGDGPDTNLFFQVSSMVDGAAGITDYTQYNTVLDTFVVEWDDHGLDGNQYTDDVTVTFNMIFYYSKMARVSIAPMTYTIKPDENNEMSIDISETGIEHGSSKPYVTINGKNYTVAKDTNYDGSKINRIVILVTGSTAADGSVGIRAFKWKRTANDSLETMPALNTEIDKYKQKTIGLTMKAITGGIASIDPEPCSALYPVQMEDQSYTLETHFTKTYIDSFTENPLTIMGDLGIDEEDKEEYISDLDEKYVSFINTMKNAGNIP